jgi:hypothetical protein
LFLGALVIGKKYREFKTARALLWTATALIPFQLAALGGLLYSQFPLEPAGATLPTVATWIAPSALSAVLVLGLSMPLFFVVARATARVLSPSLAGLWSSAFVVQSLLFLVPVRTPDWTSLLVILGCAVPLWMGRRHFEKTEAARSLEGRLLGVLLWAAPLMIALRTSIFYSPGAVFLGAMLLSLGWSMVLALRADDRSATSTTKLTETVAALSATLGSVILGDAVLSGDLESLSALFGAGSLVLMSRLSPRTGATQWTLACLGSALIGSIAVLTTNSLVVCCVFLLWCGALCAQAVLRQQLMHTVAMGVSAVTCLLSILRVAVGYEDVHLWQVLSGAGILLFAAAALLEKKRVSFVSWLDGARNGARAAAPESAALSKVA